MQQHHLARYWQPIATQYAIADAQDIFEKLLDAYTESQRAYHTLQHLEECFALFEQVKHALHRQDLVQLMIWFHDVVYDPRAKDNELQSAEYAKRVLTQFFTVDDIEYIRQGILATATHDAGQIIDYQYLMDIDLAILGTEPQRFTRYEQQIRDEYRFVEEWVYVQKRAAVLSHFLAQIPLYKTAYFQQLFEDQAKHNLKRALDHHVV